MVDAQEETCYDASDKAGSVMHSLLWAWLTSA